MTVVPGKRPSTRSGPALAKLIEAEKEKIAASRDKLREYIAEAEQLAGDCDEAVDDLRRAAETLSRLV